MSQDRNTAVNSTGALPAVQPKLDRALLLPKSLQGCLAVERTLLLRDYVVSTWLDSPRSVTELMLAFVVLASADKGLDQHLLEHTMPKLLRRDVLPHGRIALRIHPDDDSDRRSRLALPELPYLLLMVVLARQGYLRDSDAVLAPLYAKTANKARTAARGIRSVYAGLQADFVRDTGQTPPGWRPLLASGPIIAYLRGVEPAILSTTQLPTLPTSYAGERRPMLRHPAEPNPVLPCLVSFRGSIRERLAVTAKDSRPANRATTATPKHPEPDWHKKARVRLRTLQHELESITDSQLAYAGNRTRAIELIDRALGEADHHAPSTSAEHLALRWLKHKITKRSGRLTPGTLADYLGRVFFTGFLSEPESFDLSDWEPEDFETLAEERVLDTRLEPSSAQNILITFREVFRYRTDVEGCEPVNLDEIELEWSGGARRFDLMGPGEFDEHLRITSSAESRDAYIDTALGVLGYYGGMRSGEICRLRLADVTDKDGQLYIRLHRGKTRSSRRVIPLGLLATQRALRYLRNWLRIRRSEFPEDQLADVALFGPPYNPQRYERCELIDPFIERLRQAFGPALAFHHLRHNFASWFVARWVVLRNPGLRKWLVDGHAEIFAEECQNRFIRYLSSGGEQGDSPQCASVFFRLAKLIGHSHPSVTFVHYVHLTELLHMHAVDVVDNALGDQRLKAKTVQALLRGIRSKDSPVIRLLRDPRELAEALERLPRPKRRRRTITLTSQQRG